MNFFSFFTIIDLGTALRGACLSLIGQKNKTFETSFNLTNKDEALFCSCDIEILPGNQKKKLKSEITLYKLISYIIFQLFLCLLVFKKTSSYVRSEVF